MARKETEALGPALKKKLHQRDIKEVLQGDMSEYYFKKGYGINVHGKHKEGTALYSRAEAENKGLKLDHEYALFD